MIGNQKQIEKEGGSVTYGYSLNCSNTDLVVSARVDSTAAGWLTVDGDGQQSGELVFTATPNNGSSRGTVVQVIIFNRTSREITSTCTQKYINISQKGEGESSDCYTVTINGNPTCGEDFYITWSKNEQPSPPTPPTPTECDGKITISASSTNIECNDTATVTVTATDVPGPEPTPTPTSCSSPWSRTTLKYEYYRSVLNAAKSCVDSVSSDGIFCKNIDSCTLAEYVDVVVVNNTDYYIPWDGRFYIYCSSDEGDKFAIQYRDYSSTIKGGGSYYHYGHKIGNIEYPSNFMIEPKHNVEKSGSDVVTWRCNFTQNGCKGKKVYDCRISCAALTESTNLLLHRLIHNGRKTGWSTATCSTSNCVVANKMKITIKITQMEHHYVFDATDYGLGYRAYHKLDGGIDQIQAIIPINLANF
jgi:hypothetical protein